MKQLVVLGSVWAAAYNNGGGNPANGTGGALNRVLDRYLQGVSGGVCPLDKITGMFCVIANIIDKLLAIGGLIALLFLVIGGLQYMASGGDEKALTTAKGTITYSVLGLLIILGSILIVNTILFQLGL